MHLYANGIDPDTGRYLLPPLTAEDFVTAVAGKGPLSPAGDAKGALPGVDERDLARAGWGVVFAEGAPPSAREALGELLAHRREQAGGAGSRHFEVYDGERAVRRGESKWEWTARLEVGDGPADPDQMPCFLLLVGDAEAIPFRLQFELGVQRAVGRLWFERADDFATYARSVVAAETAPPRRPRTVTLFGVANDDDPATTSTSRDLVAPLLDALRRLGTGWEIRGVVREEATKARLEGLLGGEETPSLLFTASHGLGPRHGDSLADLGAILCQDWPGPRRWQERLAPEQFFAAADLGRTAAEQGADLAGLVAFHFCCYGAGVPAEDSFTRPPEAPRRLAARPCLSPLPVEELRRGALAVIGHVERAWCAAFLDAYGRRQLQTFEAVFRSLLQGDPVGLAVRAFHEKQAEILPRVNLGLVRQLRGERLDPRELEAFAGDWIAAADAESYILLGDPAVRVGGPGAR